MKFHMHTLSHGDSQRSTKEYREFGGYMEVECDSAVEGSEMKTGKIVTSGRLFLQGTEGVLHVLHQLCILGLDLGFTILNRVLEFH